jgi:oxygen-independent coproporphyrinogen-3 oxidase
LTVEQGTAFGDRYNAGKLRGLPDDDLGADLYALTQDICADHGMPAYEVSNHARDNAQSRHNLIYWRYGDYLGIGPGAHGRLTKGGVRWATEAYAAPGKWLKSVDTGLAEKPRESLSTIDQRNEFLLMGLRLREGISLSRYHALSPTPLRGDTLAELQGLGMIKIADDALIVSKQGFMILNAIISRLLEDQEPPSIRQRSSSSSSER